MICEVDGDAFRILLMEMAFDIIKLEVKSKCYNRVAKKSKTITPSQMRSLLSGEHNTVLEIKYDEFLPGFIVGLLELGNMQQSSFSKYRCCREIYMGGD